MKRITIRRGTGGMIVLLLTVVILCMGVTSCDAILGWLPWFQQEGDLEGSWTLTTTPVAGRDLGNGSFTLAYSETREISGYTVHSFTGTGTLFGRSFRAGAIQEVHESSDDAVLISLEEAANELNALSFFQATIDDGGDYINGAAYSGWNEYADDSGTFTATKR